MSITIVSEKASSPDVQKVEWRQFDEVDAKHTYAPLLTQVVDFATKGDEALVRDTYELNPLCEQLEQLKDSRAKHLLEALDHLRFYGGDGDLPKKLPSFRLKPSIHHVVIQQTIVNKQYTVRMSLTNKSLLQAHWRILAPHQDRQSVFFSCHPFKGTIEPGKQAGLSIELVLLDSRDFHRLVVFETCFGDKYMAYSAVLMTTDTAAWPEGAIVSDEMDLGDVDLDSCYWHIKPSDLRLVSVTPGGDSSTELTPTSPRLNASSNGTNGAKDEKKRSSNASAALFITTAATSSPPLQRPASIHSSPSTGCLPAGQEYQLFGIPVHVKKVSLSDESDRAEFWHEVNMMSSLRHPHLVNLIGASDYADDGQLVTRIFHHGDLRTFLQTTDSHMECKILSSKISMIMNIAQALHFTHNFDRLHRCVSASNIYLTEDYDVKLHAPLLRLHQSVGNLSKTVRPRRKKSP
jgi:hypothetical protein